MCVQDTRRAGRDRTRGHAQPLPRAASSPRPPELPFPRVGTTTRQVRQGLMKSQIGFRCVCFIERTFGHPWKRRVASAPRLRPRLVSDPFSDGWSSQAQTAHSETHPRHSPSCRSSVLSDLVAGCEARGLEAREPELLCRLSRTLASLPIPKSGDGPSVPR